MLMRTANGMIRESSGIMFVCLFVCLFVCFLLDVLMCCEKKDLKLCRLILHDGTAVLLVNIVTVKLCGIELGITLYRVIEKDGRDLNPL